jgi:glucose/arabinose dehydrogenase
MYHISSSRFAIACATGLVLAGCAKSEQAAKDSASAAAAAQMAAPAPAPAPPPALSLSAVAGKWQVKSTPISGSDTTPTKYVLTATADTTGWMIVFPSGVKVPMQVSVSGDSLIEKTGTFPSQRRKGMKVKTDAVMRLQGGKLVGTTVAHYSTKGADSVLNMRVEGTKMP